jgi:hypothetical protein
LERLIPNQEKLFVIKKEEMNVQEELLCLGKVMVISAD